MGNTMADTHHGCPGGDMQHLVKKRGWEKGEATERCQEPARGQNTNDDDEMISFISSQLRTVGQLLVDCNKAALPFNRCTDTISHMNTMRIRIRFALNEQCDMD